MGIAVADVTTGEFSFCEIAGDVESRIADELARIQPGEIIVNDTMYLLPADGIPALAQPRLSPAIGAGTG